jgi:outer membrane protein assembly factor BamA
LSILYRYTGLLFLLFVGSSILAQDALRIRSIEVEGNKKTKEYIILRELTFEVGETITLDDFQVKLKRSEENLINTSLFHFADIQISETDSLGFDVYVKVTERWYLWPIPEADIDERNFNAWWEHKSLDRISAGFYITQNNSRGRMEQWQITLIAGHNQQFGFAYEFPYINTKKTIGIGVNSLYSARHEVNIGTADDKQEFFKLHDEYAQRSFRNAIYLNHRPNYYFSQLLSLTHQYYNFADSVILLNPNYSFQNNQVLSYLSLYYKLKLDRRNYKPYPLFGYYLDLELQQDGFGLTAPKEFFYTSAKTTMRKYWQHSDRWFSAIGFIGKLSSRNEKPVMLQRALGYNREFVRGYEYYVVDGHSFALMKANVKYALIQKRNLKLDIIPTEKFNTIPYAFYLNLFTDLGYVNSNLNTQSALQNQWLTGFGVGLDFVTYYDWVMRMEFSQNKMGERGFFLHFIAPI